VKYEGTDGGYEREGRVQEGAARRGAKMRRTARLRMRALQRAGAGCGGSTGDRQFASSVSIDSRRRSIRNGLFR
jgi:hypothetical protein